MGRPDPVVAEIVIVVAVGALLGAAGPAFGAGAWPLAAALAGYVGWNLYQFDRFRRWLAHPKRARPPYRVGLWRTLVDGAQDIRDRARTRKKRLRRILEGFQESTSALPDATVVLDREWNVEWTNAMAHKYLGIARGGEQLRSILEYIGDRLFRQYLETGDFTRPLQMPAPVDDGTTPGGASRALRQGQAPRPGARHHAAAPARDRAAGFRGQRISRVAHAADRGSRLPRIDDRCRR
ncbi:MAG: phosphate regulon sensor protein PhoR [Gammaproteobacteria bacterium]|nr:phosphate regulon sensor protein PhoR [Gammaproteobacteria bacterium]